MQNARGPRWGQRGGAAPLVIAHRGASAHATENTLPAFERALRDGADGVELDVLCCATGEVVVFHDDDLLRLAGRPERVAHLPLRALRRVALPAEGRIPTLDEALEATGRDLLVNVELKSGGLCDTAVPGLVAGVAEAVRRAASEARVLVSSFDPRAVALWQRQRPDVASALLIDDEGLAATLKVLALPLLRPLCAHPAAALCRPGLVDRWHAAGYAVNVWTVDDPGELRRLRAMGVDGVICNDPAAARAALAMPLQGE
jgi:glycerophosphoryl diester phosphodiesterase